MKYLPYLLIFITLGIGVACSKPESFKAQPFDFEVDPTALFERQIERRENAKSLDIQSVQWADCSDTALEKNRGYCDFELQTGSGTLSAIAPPDVAFLHFLHASQAPQNGLSILLVEETNTVIELSQNGAQMTISHSMDLRPTTLVNHGDRRDVQYQQSESISNAEITEYDCILAIISGLCSLAVKQQGKDPLPMVARTEVAGPYSKSGYPQSLVEMVGLDMVIVGNEILEISYNGKVLSQKIYFAE